MYIVQIRWLEKRNGRYRKFYLKRQCPTREITANWVKEVSNKPEAVHIHITAWDQHRDIIYFRHDDHVEMYDSMGNVVDRLEDIGREQ